MSNWKKTSEELPEKDILVLFKTNRNTYLGYYKEDSWHIQNLILEFHPSSVKAWCKIPKYDL